MTVCFARDDLYAPPSKKRPTQKGRKRRINILYVKQSDHLYAGSMLTLGDLNTQVSHTKLTGSSMKNARKSNMCPNPPKQCQVKVKFPHKDQFSSFMHEFIEKVVHVAGDGHCGFHVVVGLRNTFFDDYYMIHYQLLKELNIEDNKCYRRLIGLDKRFNEFLRALIGDCTGPAPLDMSFLIAQRYNNMVVLLSINKGQSKTFFPLRGAPSHKDRLMRVAHVNDNHFMMVYLKDICPILPTSRIWR